MKMSRNENDKDLRDQRKAKNNHLSFSLHILPPYFTLLFICFKYEKYKKKSDINIRINEINALFKNF